MKTRSADFDIAWGNRRTRKAIYKITYKRRYWNGSAYALESTSRTIHRREIERIGGLQWKLDATFQNRILSSNVSLVLKNNGYKWLPSNTANGYWRKGGESPTYGFDPVGSEFVIHYGYVLADESEELLEMFTGLVIDDPVYDSTSGTVTIQLVGKAEAKLEAASAQNVCQTLTDQSPTPAAGDGSRTNFVGLTSLWRMSNIRIAAAVKTQGTHYTLADLNDAETAASINFTSAPANLAAILYDAARWYRDKSISELVGLLCDAAGISSGDRDIEEPIFSGVDQSNSINSAAEWAAGTLTNADATVRPGTLTRKWFCIDDFADNDFTSSPAWTTIESSGASNVVTAGGGEFDIQVVGAGASGTKLETRYMTVVGGSGKNRGSLAVRLKSSFTNASGYSAGSTYTTFEMRQSLASIGSVIIQHKSNGNVDILIDNVVAATVAISLGAYHDWRITIDTAGAVTVYCDGVSKATGTTTMTGFENVIVRSILANAVDNASDIARLYVDDIYWREAIDSAGAVVTGQMSFLSAEIDQLAAPTSWLPLTFTVTENGGTSAFKTDVASASGGPYDGETSVDGTYTPQSALKRYAKIRIDTTVDKGSIIGPEFTVMTLNWRGSSLFIKSADFTGLNCLQAVTELAKAGGMDFGSKGDGTFFFRNKTVTATADIVLSQKNAIVSASNFTPGYREVRNIGQVRYGKSGTDGYYFAEYKASDAGEASPTTAQRFGEKVISLDLQRFIFANDAQVATAIARKLYEINYRPKRRGKIKCRIIPHLDLSDRAQISIHDSPLIEKAIFGDPLQRYPVTGANSRTLARDIVMKIVGHTPDLMKSESLLDVEEVLS